MHRLTFFILILSSTSAFGADEALSNYKLHCQGCHLPEAVGVPGTVPPIKDFIGYFLHSDQGRAFLVQVPGVAYSALSDRQTAELLNWLVDTYSAAQAPQDYDPFTEEEVAGLRHSPETNPEQTRRQILHAISSTLPALQNELNDG